MSMTPKLLTIGDRTMSITEWSKEPGAARYHTIINRLLVCGWADPALAVFAPPRRNQGGKSFRRVRIVGVNRPSRSLKQTRLVRAESILVANPRQANPHPPTWGGFSSWPIEALPMLRRCA